MFLQLMFCTDLVKFLRSSQGLFRGSNKYVSKNSPSLLKDYFKFHFMNMLNLKGGDWLSLSKVY